MVDLDMCKFGLQSSDQWGTGLAMKPIRIMTDMPMAHVFLAKRCQGGHRHVQLMSGRAKAVAEYTEKFCQTMIDCFKQQVREVMMLQSVESLDQLHEPNDHWYNSVLDDVSGDQLDPVLARKGRELEMEKFKARGVYTHVTRQVAASSGQGKFVKVRWVQTNKGTTEAPNVRCRLVCQEYASGNPRDDLFAGTPPLTAAKLLVSDVACHHKEKCILILDVSCAFLYGKAKREIYIELPAEDPMGKDTNLVGKLQCAMYGTRDAPQIWQEEVGATLGALGFTTSMHQPSMYYHSKRDIKMVAHVDDFLISGTLSNVQWFWRELSKKYELKGKVMGCGFESEGVYLGRRITWKADCLEWEGDQKHAKSLLLEWDLNDCQSVVTPCEKDVKDAEGSACPRETSPMTPDKATAFRSACAKINYMAQDRFDLTTAANKLSRSMSKPMQGDEEQERILRVIKYLKGSPRCVYRFAWQESPKSLTIMTDSDWANCPVTRRSVSGGLVMNGSHLIGHWSKMQVGVALSSGEAELNAQVKGIAEGICLRNISKDWGITVGLSSWCDSSAARGILNRIGVGKIKHLDVKQLWVQQHTNNGDVSVHRVPRIHNAADHLTHAGTATELVYFCQWSVM